MTRLTKAQIDRAQADGRDLFIWDSTQPGFGIRVKPSAGSRGVEINLPVPILLDLV